MQGLDFAQITGVGVAALSVYLMWKLCANHINRNSDVIEELKDAIKELTNFLQNKR